MKSKDVSRKVSCVTSDLELHCTVVHNRIQELVLQACGFTQACPNSKELNVQVGQYFQLGHVFIITIAYLPELLQVLLKSTGKHSSLEVACLDSTGAILAQLPLVSTSIRSTPLTPTGALAHLPWMLSLLQVSAVASAGHQSSQPGQ